MELDEFLNQGEPNATSLISSALLALNAMKALKQAWHFMRRNSDAAIADGQLGFAVHLTQADCDLALERELECIGEKIEHDLLPHVTIDIGGLRERWTIDDEAQAGALACRAKVAGELTGIGGKVSRFVGGLRTSRFDAGKIKQ
jgi:hypothetical protein